MQPVLPDPPTQPFASLSIELEAFSGINNIRRSLGRSVGLWTGAAQADRFFVVQPSTTIVIDEDMTVFLAVSDGPLTVTVNSLTLPMQKVLLLDTPSTGGVTFNNSGSGIVNFHISYLVPAFEPVAPS